MDRRRLADARLRAALDLPWGPGGRCCVEHAIILDCDEVLDVSLCPLCGRRFVTWCPERDWPEFPA